MANNTLQEIGKQLEKSNKIFIFPHVQIDGDALGSSVALCLGLRKMGKQAWILLEDKVPDFLSFLLNGCCTWDKGVFDHADTCIAVDCSEAERIEKRNGVFLSGNIHICLDHHATAESFAEFCYIDATAPATGEIVYDLLREMDVEIDGAMADALYVALTTDTGNFCYSNTTKKTHLIVADLYDYGLNHTPLCAELYENVSRERIALRAAALNEMEFFCEGKANLTYVSQNMLERFQASMDETEGIIDELRRIQGVEISALLKEKEDGVVKVSLRAKSYGNVAAIAAQFGGGGHIKAAGCTIHGSVDEVKKKLEQVVEQQLREVN